MKTLLLRLTVSSFILFGHGLHAASSSGHNNAKAIAKAQAEAQAAAAEVAKNETENAKNERAALDLEYYFTLFPAPGTTPVHLKFWLETDTRVNPVAAKDPSTSNSDDHGTVTLHAVGAVGVKPTALASWTDKTAPAGDVHTAWSNMPSKVVSLTKAVSAGGQYRITFDWHTGSHRPVVGRVAIAVGPLPATDDGWLVLPPGSLTKTIVSGTPPVAALAAAAPSSSVPAAVAPVDADASDAPATTTAPPPVGPAAAPAAP